MVPVVSYLPVLYCCASTARILLVIHKATGWLRRAEACRGQFSIGFPCRVVRQLGEEQATSEGLRRAKARVEREAAEAAEGAAEEAVTAKAAADALLSRVRAEQVRVLF